MVKEAAQSISDRVIRKALKIANDSSDRRVKKANIWIDHPLAVGLAADEYQVRYSLPKVDGVFICNRTLTLSAVEYYAYVNVNNID